MRIFVVEDELHLSEALSHILKKNNYTVDVANDGETGLDNALSGIYDVIVLNIMLPKTDGITVLKTLRSEGFDTPVILLTAKNEISDKVLGLDSGADDYLTKPFMTRELLARLRALGRRKFGMTDDTLTYGDIMLDTNTLTLSCTENEQSVRLSEKEYRILEYLIANRGQILTREQLAVKIWGYESEAEYNNVEVYISFTRKKLTFIGSETEIKAVRGIGYELRCSGV